MRVIEFFGYPFDKYEEIIRMCSMIQVVFSSDHNFIIPTYVAILSMLANASRRCKVYLLISEDVTEDDKDILRQLVEKYDAHIEFISMGSVFDNTYSIRGITKATYFRLLIPWIIPDVDKVLYLDGDIIVAGDIAQLYDYSVDEKYLICGVRTPGYSTNGWLKKHISKNGLDYKEYINAGILLMNCHAMRLENFKPIFLSHTDKQYFFQDQDILNITCKGRIGYLPLKFNFSGKILPKVKDAYIALGLASNEEVEEAETAPVVVHYAGPKPWKEFTYRWNDWVEYYKMTPFYDQCLIDNISYKTLHPDFNFKKVIKSLLKRP